MRADPEQPSLRPPRDVTPETARQHQLEEAAKQRMVNAYRNLGGTVTRATFSAWRTESPLEFID